MESAEAFVELVLDEGSIDYENGDIPELAIALVKSRDAAIHKAAMEEREALIKQMGEALDDISSVYYQRGVSCQKNSMGEDKCMCNVCVDKRVKTALMAYREAAK